MARQINQKALEKIIKDDPGLQLVTLATIAGTYGVSTRTLQRYIKAGELRAVRFGRKYCVTVSELRRFLNEREKA